MEKRREEGRGGEERKLSVRPQKFKVRFLNIKLSLFEMICSPKQQLTKL